MPHPVRSKLNEENCFKNINFQQVVLFDVKEDGDYTAYNFIPTKFLPSIPLLMLLYQNHGFHVRKNWTITIFYNSIFLQSKHSSFKLNIIKIKFL